MNLLGITWGMGARDVGMKAAVDSAQKGLNNLNDGLERQSKIASKSKMAGFFDGIKNSVKNFNIASIASDINSLTGDTGNLSSSLESMGVANAKAAAPFVASMNLSADAARKMTSRISGMAIGMNVGAESVAKVYTEFNRMTPAAKETAKALGMTEKDFVKFTETTGVSIEDLNSSITDLTGSWGMAPKKVATFLNSMTELGKKTGMGMSPIKGMKENLQALDDTFEKLPPGMQRTGDEITALMESSVRLAGAFAAQGASQEDAMKMGADTAKMFAEQSTQIERLMKTGFGADSIEAASPLIKYLTGLGIGFDEAKGIIDTGSRDTVKGVQAMQAAFTKYNVTGAQQQAMLSGLSESMGESVKGLGYLASGGDAAAAKLKEMSDVTVVGKDTLKAYGDQAFRSGRTLQDAYDLAKEGFDMQIRSISRADVKGLIGSKMGAFREVGKEIKALAADDGPMGMLVRGMSTFKQMGMGGVFLQVGKAMGVNVKEAQKMSIKYSLAFETMQGFAKELGPVMSLIGQFGPMGIAAGGIVGFFMLSDADRSKILESLGPLWEKAKAMASDLWYGTKGKTGIKQGLIDAWDDFSTYVQGQWPEWKENIKTLFSWLGKEVLPGVIEFGKTVAGSVFNAIVDHFGTGGVLIGGAFAGAIMGAKFGPWGGLVGFVAGSLIAGSEAAISDAEKRIKGFEDAQKASKEAAKMSELAGSQEIQDRRMADLEKLKQAYLDTQYKITGSMYFPEGDIENDQGFIKFRDSFNQAIGSMKTNPVDWTKIVGGPDIGKALVEQQMQGVMAAQEASRAEMVASGSKAIKGYGIAGKAVWALGGALGAPLAEGIQSMFDAGVIQEKMDAEIAKIDAGGKVTGQQTLMEQFAGVQHFPEVQAMFAQLQQQGASATDYLKAAQEAVSKYSKTAATDSAQAMVNAQSINGQLFVTFEGLQDNLSGVATMLGTDKTTLLQKAVEEGLSLGTVIVRVAADLGRMTGQNVVLIEPDQLSMLKEATGMAGEYIGQLKSVGGISDKEAAYIQDNAEWYVESGPRMSEEGKDIMGNALPTVQAAPENPLIAAAGAFAQQVKGTMGEVGSAMSVVASGFKAQNEIIAKEASIAGKAIVVAEGSGISDNAWVISESADAAAQLAKDRLGASSPIIDGPLAGVGSFGEGDPAWRAGRTLMESFAAGIDGGAMIVADAVARVLDESVIATFDTYKAKMEEIAKKKSLLQDVASMMVRDFGGNLESTITIDDKTEDVKSTMKAMLNIPGLAGVTMAIINESAKQRAILDKIRGFTQTIAESEFVTKGGTPTTAPVLGG
jgi:hypothetical protein